MTIEQLSDAQVRMLDAVRDEWIRHGLSTEPANWAEAEAGVRDAYARAGLAPPEIIVRLASPMAGAIATSLLLAPQGPRVRAQVGAQVGDQVLTQIGAQVGDQVLTQIGAQVRDQVRAQVGAQVRAQVRAQVGAQVGDQVGAGPGVQVGAQVRAQVRDQVGAQVGDQVGAGPEAQVGARVWRQVWARVGAQVGARVWRQVWARVEAQVGDQVGAGPGVQVGAQVRAQVWARVGAQVGAQVWARVGAGPRDQVWSAIRGQHDAGWLAWVDAMARLGVTCDAQGLQRVGKSAGWWWALSGIAVITDRPSELHLDEQGRLHSADGPALLYRDGWGIHAWHGICVPSDLIEDGWGVRRIMLESNAEIRRCAVEIMAGKLGWGAIIQEAGWAQVGVPAPDPANPQQVLRLYHIPRSRGRGRLTRPPRDADGIGLYDEPVRLLLCSNATVERDGTRHEFGLTVPADISDPVAAAAWTFDLDPDIYRALQRAC